MRTARVILLTLVLMLMIGTASAATLQENYTVDNSDGYAGFKTVDASSAWGIDSFAIYDTVDVFWQTESPEDYDVYYVSTSGSDGNNGATPGTAFATPEKAISVVNDGDTIYIANGTYENQHLVIPYNNISIIGAGYPER